MHRFVLLIVVVFHFVAALAQARIEVPDAEVASHRLAIPALSIRLPQDCSQQWYVELQVVVGPDGSVTSAVPYDGNVLYFDAAARAVRNWSYEPFLREGKPVTGTRSGLRCSAQAALARALPTRFMFMGDGTVHYIGRAYVQLCGNWTAEI